MHKLLHIFVLFLHLIWQFSEVATAAANLPHNPCPELFQYMENNGNYFGLITLKNMKPGTTNLDVQLSHTTATEMHGLGRISLFDSEQNTINNIKNSLPVLYRIEFPNSKIPPKLNRIIVNDDVICSDNGAKFQLQHTLLTLSDCAQTSSEQSTPPTQEKLNDFSKSTTESQLISKHARKAIPSQQHNSKAPKPLQQKPKPILNQNIQNSTIENNSELNKSCGLANPRAFVQGGAKLNPGQIPWITPIYITKRKGIEFACGGTLISSRTVISDAKDFRIIDPDQITVFVGAHNLDQLQTSGAVAHGVSRVEFSGRRNEEFDNEIALLILESPVRFSSFVQPACLSTESDELEEIVGLLGYVAGWGSETGKYSSTPSIIDAVIASHATCLRSHSVFAHLLESNTFCAGNRDATGPCLGDSGSGLVVNRKGLWTIRGVVLSSLYNVDTKTCNLYEFLVYADVAKHMTWIRKNMLP